AASSAPGSRGSTACAGEGKEVAHHRPRARWAPREALQRPLSSDGYERREVLRARKLLALGFATLALGVVAVGCGDDDSSSDSGDNNAASSDSGGNTPIKVAYLSDCEGDFGAFFEPDIAGANTAFIKFAGGKAAGSKPSDGLDGATVAGHPTQFVGAGCAAATAAKAIEETRRLMEQEDADILIGPLSGDEGIAVANYAKEHPAKTFINGTSGAQDTTLKVQAPNFFRFHSDGAQWSAGLGDYAYNELGWRTAAIIGDDYSFPYTPLAGRVRGRVLRGGRQGHQAHLAAAG